METNLTEVYLDNSATTRCSERAKDLMVKVLMEDYGNPSSLHMKGVEAENYIKKTNDNRAYSGLAPVRARPWRANLKIRYTHLSYSGLIKHYSIFILFFIALSYCAICNVVLCQ